MERKPITIIVKSDIGADALRTAIVEQAVKDFVHGHTMRNKKRCMREQAIQDMHDAEEFLLGEWAEWLVDMDCKWILTKVKEMLNETSKKNNTEDEAEDL